MKHKEYLEAEIDKFRKEIYSVQTEIGFLKLKEDAINAHLALAEKALSKYVGSEGKRTTPFEYLNITDAEVRNSCLSSARTIELEGVTVLIEGVYNGLCPTHIVTEVDISYTLDDIFCKQTCRYLPEDQRFICVATECFVHKPISSRV